MADDDGRRSEGGMAEENDDGAQIECGGDRRGSRHVASGFEPASTAASKLVRKRPRIASTTS